MRILSFVPIFLAVSVNGYAADDSATSQLNPDLVPIYERLVAEGQGSDLVGKRIELRLHLRHASERFLLFSDTRVVLGKDTKYYLIKWKFEPTEIENFIGKSDVTCNVSGRIVEVVSGAKASGMPYIIVELISLEL